ncbi:tetratricopeptide repeat protein [Waterburya agarophytonicola K14]|uniref:Tetratricopeptide repeat protein n=1 Tax=Waterburya agarophytonicola KI4 TaxID=2874699 RepID=A0A964BLP7_9CYAN|nr:tetratricopeptide repeat protein [Waterburya agarophytonicola]MCC0175698.1 tetratricopeptide repeat protein [Waterburya agarophytonicola KI4]
MNQNLIVGRRYQLIKELGKNDWNTIYLAKDATMPEDFRCIVEQFRLEPNQNISIQNIKTRYGNEVNLWQQLANLKQLPPILACFEEGEALYLVRELIKGRNLMQRLEQYGKLSQLESIALLKDVLSSLIPIHESGLVHQNIKPSNIIICDRNDKYFLIDFSLVEPITQESAPEDKATALIYSSNEYYPNKQPANKITSSRDLYALGAIAIETITGKKPNCTPVHSSLGSFLAQECSQIDSQLLKVIERMMDLDSPNNYGSAQEARQDLERIESKFQSKQEIVDLLLDATATNSINSSTSSQSQELGIQDKLPLQRKSFSPSNLWKVILGLLLLVGVGEFFYPILRPQYHCHQGNKILSNNSKQALNRFQKAIKLNSNSICGGLGTAQAFYELERYPAALAAYDRVDSIKPDLIATWQGRGEVLHRLERFEAATTAYNKTLKMEPNNSAIWNRKGKALYKLELFQEALAAQDKALALQPDNVNALTDRGVALIGLGKYQEALDVFNQAQEIDPLDPQLWQNKALVLQYLNRPQESVRLYQEALEAYEKVIAENPKNITAILDRANVLSKLQQHEEALVTYQQAVAINENSHLTWLGKGNALFALRRYPEALAAFDRAVKVQPKSYISWHNRGSLLRDGLRDLPKAIASYDRALQVNPNFYHAWRDRGIALSQNQQHTEAIESFKKALNIKPNDHQSWVGRGIALSSLGKIDEAISVIDRAIEIQPQDPFVWMNRAVILETAKNYPEACNSYRQVKKIRPGFSPAIQKLKQLGCK